MIVWITHAKVGHRQAPYRNKQKAQSPMTGLFAFYGRDKVVDG